MAMWRQLWDVTSNNHTLADIDQARLRQLLPLLAAINVVAWYLLTPTPLDEWSDAWPILISEVIVVGACVVLLRQHRERWAAWLLVSISAAAALMALTSTAPVTPIGKFALIYFLPVWTAGMLLGDGPSLVVAGGIMATQVVLFTSARLSAPHLAAPYALAVEAVLTALVLVGLRTLRGALRTASHADDLARSNADLAQAMEELQTQQEALQSAQSTLRYQHDFAEAVLASISPAMLLVTDVAGNVVRCNEALLTTLGYTADEVMGQSTEQIFGGEAALARVEADVTPELLGQRRVQREVTVYTRDGTPLRIEFSAEWNEDLSAFIVLGHDVTARTALEHQLADTLASSERRELLLDAVFRSVHDGLAIFDAAGTVVARNAISAQILGFAQDVPWRVAASATPFHLFTMAGEPVPQSAHPLDRLMRGEEVPAPETYRLVQPNGNQLVVQMEVVPLRDAAEAPVGTLGIVRDVTTEQREKRYNSLLRTLAHALAQALDERAIGEATAATIMGEMNTPNFILLLRDDDRPGYARILEMHMGREVPAEKVAQQRFVFTNTRIAPDAPAHALQVLATGVPHFNGAAFPLPDAQGVPRRIEAGQVTTLPLCINGEVIGALGLGFAPDTGNWATPDGQVLQAVADEIATALHRARLYAAAQQLAYHDPLTGVRNHRALQGALTHELTVAAAQGLPVSAIMLDVDHFRRFNEMYGHDVGDQALREVAAAITRAVRSSDIPARYGGEEFAVVLPGSGASDAALIAERIRAAIADSRIEVAGLTEPLRVTASLGYATFPQHASMPSSLLKAADLALYAAKHAGRNRVMAYSPELLPQGDEMSLALPAHASIETAQAFIMALDLRDGYTAAHSEGVSRYAVALARRLGLSPEQVEHARLGGLIHDIGKVAVPDDILRKTAPLTPEEWTSMRAHTVRGEEILRGVAALHPVLPLVRWHHERLDGSGYPDGLVGDAIPLLVRVLSVADVFEAFTAERPYHPGRPLHEGLAHLHGEAAAGRLDAAVVAALHAIISAEDAAPPSREQSLAA